MLPVQGSVSHPSGSWLACPEQQHCVMCRGESVPAPPTTSPTATSFPPWGSPTSPGLLNQVPARDAEHPPVEPGC